MHSEDMQGTKEVEVVPRVPRVMTQCGESLAFRDKVGCPALTFGVIEGFLSMLCPRVKCVCKERVAVQRFIKLILGVDRTVLESAFGEVGCANCGGEGMRVWKYFSQKAVECLLDRVIYRHEVRRKTITLSPNRTYE